jgi:hypothetical protein
MLLPEPVIPLIVQRAFDVSIHDATIVGGGFSGADVFRATTDDGRDLAIRRTPKLIALPSGRLSELHHLLREMSRRGCDTVAVPMLAIKSPASAVESWLKYCENVWQMEPWLPGASLIGQEMTSLHLSAAMVALDQFHRMAAESVDAVSPSEWLCQAKRCSPAAQRRLTIATDLHYGILGTLRRKLVNDQDARFRCLAIRVCESLEKWTTWLLRELTEVAAMRFALQPVLRDVWRAHVLFTEYSVTGLIDLTAAASDHVTLDITRLLRSWYGADNSKIEMAVNEFQTLRPLNANERRLLQAFDASTVLLSPVTWLRRRLDSGDDSMCRDDVIARLTELTDVAENFRPLEIGL